MVVILVVLSIWVLLNILFVLIVIPARKPRQPSPQASTLSHVPIDRHQGQFEQDEPFSLRQVVASVAMGAFFVLVPPLLALRDAVVRFFRKLPGA